MKKIFLLSLAAISTSLYSQTENNFKADIKSVTVYQQGAQISRENDINIPKGENTLIIKGLSSKIQPSSVQVSATNDVMIVSVSHSIDYLNKIEAGKEQEKLTERSRIIVDSIKVLNNIKTVYSQEKEMILANKSIAGDNGVNINELEQAATFFRNRLMEIESSVHKLDINIYNLKTELFSVSKQLFELNSKIDSPTSQIKIVLSSKVDTKSNIRLSYFIPDAGWTPSYDVRIKEINEPMDLFYKAKVSQNTDENWNNVRLTLSTGNPSISNNKPDLSTYYLTFNNYYKTDSPNNYTSDGLFHGTVSGRVTDAETNEPLVGTSIVIKGTSNGTIADIDGNYSINVPDKNNILVYSFIGYNSQEIPASSAKTDVRMISSSQNLDEVVVTAYGVKRSALGSLSGIVSGLSTVKKKEQIPVAIEKKQTTTEFQIDIPYSIPSDNQKYDVKMIDYEIKAGYQYSAVPKLSENAYLTAKVPDWVSYNLMSGNASVFFKDIYQGETYIDLENASDTLAISVGRDKDIAIKRDIQKDYTKKNISGQTKKEQKAWTISIKNNKAIPVEISVEDQYPVSNTDEIKVDLEDCSDALIDKSTGKLVWNLSLNPSEKKNISLKYSVKYPSDKPIIVE